MNKIIMKSIAIIISGIIIFLGLNYFLYGDAMYLLKPSISTEISKISYKVDVDNDGLNDLDDILQGARKEVENRTKYKSAYYEGGYPPEDEGVCTDVIWRSFQNAGYDIKLAIDNDINEYVDDYPNIENPDPNIDFRRVVNLYIFFNKYMNNLTMDIIPYDAENLEQWQGGDIVVLENPSHIAIISDYRRKDGVPYIIHNAGPYPNEQDKLLTWYNRDRIIGHYRIVDVE